MYIDTIIKHDIKTLDVIKPDPKRMSALISAIARNVGTQVSNEKLARESDISTERTTIRRYLDQLIITNVLEELDI
jgi:predicted AAA+ superfamily ATPase